MAGWERQPLAGRRIGVAVVLQGLDTDSEAECIVAVFLGGIAT